MSDPTLIADMVRAGIDPEIIGRVANAIAAASASGGIRVDVAAEKRRAWDREYRKNRKANPPEIHPNPPEHENALFLSSSSIDSEIKKEKKERARGHRIPPDWKPTEKHYEEAAALGHDPPWVDHQSQDMRLWAEANSHRAVARKISWDVTFSGWMRRNGGKNGKPWTGGSGPTNPDPRSALAVLRAMRPADGEALHRNPVISLPKG